MRLPNNFHPSWIDIATEPLSKDFMILLKKKYIPSEKRRTEVYPDNTNIFRAFNINIEDLKVVIINSKPYCKPGTNTGLAFDTPSNKSVELSNICLLLDKNNKDLDVKKWSAQGVMLLNAALTCVKGNSYYHIEWWKKFLVETITNLSTKKEKIVYVSMGKEAKDILQYANIDWNINSFIHCEHPLNKTKFLQSNVFNRINNYLITKINW